MTTIIADRPRGGLTDVADDIEDWDNERGPEPEDAFTALVAHLVADGDRRARAAGRRAPRTVAEMLARQSAVMGGGEDDGPRPTGRPDWILDTAMQAQCPRCQGAGGKEEDTSDGTTVRRTWHQCGSCGGTGTI